MTPVDTVSGPFWYSGGTLFGTLGVVSVDGYVPLPEPVDAVLTERPKLRVVVAVKPVERLAFDVVFCTFRDIVNAMRPG